MTLVHAETGEVVEMMNETEARRLVDRINRAAVDLVQTTERIWRGRAWLALGYDSWDDLCAAEFTEMPRLGRDQRAELVRSLRDIGMSTRAIASAVGVAKATVQRDLPGGPNGPPGADPAPITGTDGKTYQPTAPTPKERHDHLQASSATTWADVIAAYPQATEARPSERENLRRGFVQLQTMTGPEKVRREQAFLAAIDHAGMSDHERAERRSAPATEVRQTKCRTCGRAFGPDQQETE